MSQYNTLIQPIKVSIAKFKNNDGSVDISKFKKELQTINLTVRNVFGIRKIGEADDFVDENNSEIIKQIIRNSHT
jgi:hypothetical protein